MFGVLSRTIAFSTTLATATFTLMHCRSLMARTVTGSLAKCIYLTTTPIPSTGCNGATCAMRKLNITTLYSLVTGVIVINPTPIRENRDLIWSTIENILLTKRDPVKNYIKSLKFYFERTDLSLRVGNQMLGFSTTSSRLTQYCSWSLRLLMRPKYSKMVKTCIPNWQAIYSPKPCVKKS